MIVATLTTIAISSLVLLAIVIVRGEATGIGLAMLLAKLVLAAVVGLLAYWGLAPDGLASLGL